MNFTIPDAMPEKHEFFKKFLGAIFPDIPQATATAPTYANACLSATKELDIPYTDESEDVRPIPVDSNLFRLMAVMYETDITLLKKDTRFISEKTHIKYSGSLHTICDSQNGSLKNWLKPDKSAGRINKGLDAALFFTYLLLCRNECKNSRIDFFKYCLSCIGINDIEPSVQLKLFSFDWSETGGNATIDKINYTPLENKAIKMFAITTLTIIEFLGSRSSEQVSQGIQAVHNRFSALFAEEKRLLKCLTMQNKPF